MKQLQYIFVILALAFLTTSSTTLELGSCDTSGKVSVSLLLTKSHASSSTPIVSDLPKPRHAFYSLVPRGDFSQTFVPYFNLSCSCAVPYRNFGGLHYFQQLKFSIKQPKSIAQLMCFLI